MRTHTKTFHIRFTEKEYARLCKHAERAGLPKSTYIRHMIDGVWPKERPPAEYFPILRELHEAGNKLSSASYMAYQYGGIHKKTLEEASELYAKTLFRIREKIEWLDKADIPAALERGRQVAEADKYEEEEEPCEAIAGESMQTVTNPWSIQVAK